MRKLLMSLFTVTVLMASCTKDPPPPPDVNAILTDSIAVYKTYFTKAPQTEYFFTFTKGEVEQTPNIYSVKVRNTPEPIYKGTWEVKNERIFLYKQVGLDFDKIEGSEIKNGGKELLLKTGTTILNLYAGEHPN